jgi:phosphonatase-like hydrolase
MSPALIAATTQNILEGFELMVCDMAGTTVEEGGVVYETLREVMVADGLDVSQEEMHPWHGAKKEAVLEHFCRKAKTPSKDLEERITRVADNFLEEISKKYFSEDSPVRHIDPMLPGYFRKLRDAGVKVSLDTGYPEDIQELLVKKLGFDDKSVVDSYISAYTVKEGRPYPYMIHRLMERTGVMDVRKVVKVGDSVRDIEEGKNAGCGLVVGVLSGADDAETLLAAGADLIAECVTDLPVPRKIVVEEDLRVPDMS